MKLTSVGVEDTNQKRAKTEGEEAEFLKAQKDAKKKKQWESIREKGLDKYRASDSYDKMFHKVAPKARDAFGQGFSNRGVGL